MAWTKQGTLTWQQTLATCAPGTEFSVIYDGTNWTYNGATVTARPSARTDLTMKCRNPVDATVPAWALDGDYLSRETA